MVVIKLQAKTFLTTIPINDQLRYSKNWNISCHLNFLFLISGSIDVDRIIRERDLNTVDENVNNVVDYCLESEYDVKILDPNFVKLFRLSQLAVEYLLYCKQYLDQSVVILKEELKYKLEENVKLKEEVAQYQNTVKDMKEKFKEKNKSIEIKSEVHGEIHKVSISFYNLPTTPLLFFFFW